MHTFLWLINKFYGTNYVKNNVKSWGITENVPECNDPMEFFKIVWQTYWRDIPPTEKDINLWLMKLRENGHKITIITNQQLDTAIPVHKWLIMQEIPFDTFIVNRSCEKADYPIDVLLDDNIGNVKLMLERGKKAYLYPQPWNYSSNLPKSTVLGLATKLLKQKRG